MRLISVLALILILSGCATPKENVIIKTEYKTIEVPVMYKLDRPELPEWTDDMSAPEYLAVVISYLRKLEHIIDGVK